jgi:prepilin-type N-terminal cleavage/methylation domain-containing protein
MVHGQRGFTLVELLVTMAVFMVVIMITADSFNLILGQSTKLFRSEESNIEGIIGLEQLRHDLQQGGFGLPYEFPSTPPQYSEAANVPASTYNDAPSGVPRAFTAGNNLSGISDSGSEAGNTHNILANSDYLAIRGTTVGRSKSSQRWTYMRYSSASPKPNTWTSTADNIDNSAWVIVQNQVFSNGAYTKRLVVDSSQAQSSNLYFAANYDPTGFAATNFNPVTTSDVHFIYGIDANNIRMPFNRTDYFVSRPTASGRVPSICAPNTGILYKTVVKQSDGKLDYIPILDCVADMQVIFGWDLKNAGSPGNDGLIDTYSNADGSSVNGDATVAEVQAALADTAAIRQSLKLVKVYILAQNGRRDSNYTSPATIVMGEAGEMSLTRPAGYALAADMLNYRWKLYRVVVRPKNLQSNQ